MANTTWNPADLSNVTLSNANLTASVNSFQTGGARGAHSQTAGKYYWEYTVTGLVSGSCGAGLSLATASLPSPTTGNVRLDVLSAGILVNGAASGSSLGSVSQGNIIGVAIDFTGRLIWFRIAPAGNWNGSGTADPATATGGVNISAISGALFPSMVGQSGSPKDIITGNFGDSAFSGTTPVGFTAGFPAGGGATAVQAWAMVLA